MDTHAGGFKNWPEGDDFYTEYPSLNDIDYPDLDDTMSTHECRYDHFQ